MDNSSLTWWEWIKKDKYAPLLVDKEFHMTPREIAKREKITIDDVFVDLVPYDEYMEQLQKRFNQTLIIGTLVCIIGHIYVRFSMYNPSFTMIKPLLSHAS